MCLHVLVLRLMPTFYWDAKSRQGGDHQGGSTRRRRRSHDAHAAKTKVPKEPAVGRGESLAREGICRDGAWVCVRIVAALFDPEPFTNGDSPHLRKIAPIVGKLMQERLHAA